MSDDSQVTFGFLISMMSSCVKYWRDQFTNRYTASRN